MVLAAATAPVFGAVMLVLGGVVLAVSARYVWRAGAVVRASVVESLADVPAGTLVRVTGTAQQGDARPLSAPFSGRDCLALRYGVEERRLSPILLPWFVTIHEIAGADAFRVRTSASTVDVVEPAHTVVLDEQVVATVGPDAAPPDRIAQFEAGAAAIPRSTIWRDPPSVLRPLARFLGLGTRRYVEQRAVPGDEVTVVGRVASDGAGIDPRVVSDASPRRTVLRMATTSVAGLGIGAFALLLGVAMVLL
jgi:hypothetical protein